MLGIKHTLIFIKWIEYDEYLSIQKINYITNWYFVKIVDISGKRQILYHSILKTSGVLSRLSAINGLRTSDVDRMIS